MTQPYPPRQPQYPGQWGQQQGWPAQQVQQGWNRPQQGFGQQAWLQPQQQPAGYPAGGQYGYQQPGGFTPAPAPQRGGRSPLGRILVMLVAVCGLLLVGVIVANLSSGRSPGANPTPDNWTPPPVDTDPSDLPAPKTYTEATDWVKNNSAYNQSITIPTNCSDLQPIDALNASEDELNAHLQLLTACLVKVWQGPLEAAGFEMPRPPATVYNQPIQTACGKLDSVNATYCGADQRIYYAKPLPKIFPQNLQDSRFLMEMILGHEFGHAIQARTGILISSNALEQRESTESKANVWSRRIELQADCLAGMWVQSVAPSSGLSGNDLTVLTQVAGALGDDELSGKPNIDSGHGLGQTRQRWFSTGLTGGAQVSTCNTFTVPDGQVR